MLGALARFADRHPSAGIVGPRRSPSTPCPTASRGSSMPDRGRVACPSGSVFPASDGPKTIPEARPPAPTTCGATACSSAWRRCERWVVSTPSSRCTTKTSICAGGCVPRATRSGASRGPSCGTTSPMGPARCARRRGGGRARCAAPDCSISKHASRLSAPFFTALTFADDLRRLLMQGHVRAARHLLVAAFRHGLGLPDDLRPPSARAVTPVDAEQLAPPRGRVDRHGSVRLAELPAHGFDLSAWRVARALRSARGRTVAGAPGPAGLGAAAISRAASSGRPHAPGAPGGATQPARGRLPDPSALPRPAAALRDTPSSRPGGLALRARVLARAPSG